MAPSALGNATSEGNSWRIKADVPPAISEATTYFQTVEIIGVMPKCIGLPAYQKPGRVRIQKDALQAAATPTGPQRNPRRKSDAVTLNSTITQRNQRSALPMER